MKRSVIYPGSFDPLTNGHVNIVNRALKCFDKIIVAVAVNSNKDSILDIDERVKAIKKVFQKIKMCLEKLNLKHLVVKLNLFTCI